MQPPTIGVCEPVASNESYVKLLHEHHETLTRFNDVKKLTQQMKDEILELRQAMRRMLAYIPKKKLGSARV